MAVVEGEGKIAGSGEAFGIGIEAHLLDATKPVADHNRWTRTLAIGDMKPSATFAIAGAESHVLPLKGVLLGDRHEAQAGWPIQLARI